MGAPASHATKVAAAELDDDALVAAYRAGADAAFAELVRRHQIAVFRLLLGLTADADEAERYCEQVFFEAAKRMQDAPQDLKLGAWLSALAGECVRKDEHKQQAAKPPRRAGPRPRDPKALVKQEVKSALGDLSGDERVALILADLEGDSFETIARTLGRSPSDAEQLVETARSKFERGLQQHDQPTGEAVPHPAAKLSAGTVLGRRFRIEELLGQGGMGTVYRAIDLATNQPVAVKTLLPASQHDSALRRRFAREAEIIERLQHPNFVKLIEYGQHEGEPSYVAMELLSGDALNRVLRRESRLAPRRALHITSHVLSGLTYAHAQGIVHRDLKPENVMLLQQGEDPDFAKVLDLGIAKLVAPDDAHRTRLTQQGELMGTPLYISPEMLRGEPLDARADLYSLTVMLYEMLAARPPFESATSTALYAMHLAAPPPSLADVAPELALPAALERLLQQGLAKEPAERIPSAEAYLRHVDELLRLDWESPLLRAGAAARGAIARAEPPQPQPAPRDEAARAPSRREPWPLRALRTATRSRSSLVTVVLGVLALIALVYWVTRDIARSAP